MIANVNSNVRAPLGRDFSKLADAIRNVQAPFGRCFSTFVDAFRNVRAPFEGDFSRIADAIRSIRAPLGQCFSTLADAMCSVRAAFRRDFSTLTYAILFPTHMLESFGRGTRAVVDRNAVERESTVGCVLQHSNALRPRNWLASPTSQWNARL